MTRPTIDVGTVIQASPAPGWFKRLWLWLKGLVIHAGPVDIRLDQGQVPPARTGLDQPHRIEPPKSWGPR